MAKADTRSRKPRAGPVGAVLERLAVAQEATQAELHDLTAQVRYLTEQVHGLADAQRRTEEHLATLARTLDTLAQDFTVVKRDIHMLTDHVGSLRGDQFERRYRENAFAYFSHLLRKISVVSKSDQAGFAEQAAGHGTLSVEQATDLKHLDLIVRGEWVDGSDRSLAVEVSAVVDQNDVDRAVRRAALLAKTGLAAVPVVAGERIEPTADQAARQADVWRVLDGVTVSPTETVPPNYLAAHE